MKRFSIYLLALLCSLVYTSCSSDDDSGQDLSVADPTEIAETLAGTKWSVRYDIASKKNKEHESWRETWTFSNNGTLTATGSEDGESYTDRYSYRFYSSDGKLYFVLDRENTYEVLTLTSRTFKFFADDSFDTETISGSKK